jgi:hypothetical protein
VLSRQADAHAPDVRPLQLGPDLVQPLDDGGDLALALDVRLPLGVYGHLVRQLGDTLRVELRFIEIATLRDRLSQGDRQVAEVDVMLREFCRFAVLIFRFCGFAVLIFRFCGFAVPVLRLGAPGIRAGS